MLAREKQNTLISSPFVFEISHLLDLFLNHIPEAILQLINHNSKSHRQEK